MYGLLTESKDETARAAFDRDLDRPLVSARRNGNRPMVDVAGMIRLTKWMELEAVDG